MKLLLTNDDGIDAPGLAALARTLPAWARRCSIAPHTHLSGCSHRVTTDQPLRLEARGDTRFALDGTPADCVRVGLAHLMPHADWVVAGLNHGGNLGADVHHSGTVAAVREAACMANRESRCLTIVSVRLELDWDRAVRLGCSRCCANC